MSEPRAETSDPNRDDVTPDAQDPAGQTVTIGEPAPPRLSRVGHYTLVRVIDGGGMGTVYEAVQDRPKRTVAVKVMRHGFSSPAAIRRFEFESQVLARLRHPGIAQVYEAGTEQQGALITPFFAMEFVPGGLPITAYANKHKLTLRQKLELFAEVCDALQHAHDKGILHRDLKPQNILIDLNGRPKLIDFGIARAVDADQASPTLQTAPDQLLGTLQYMAPEQLDGDARELDARADVYAMGVVLYELICKRLPYDVTTSRLAEASRVIREEPPLKPHMVVADLDQDLETIVLKALHKDRPRRYQTVRELAEDVRHVIRNEPITASLDSAAYVLATRVRAVATRHRIGAVVLAGICALLLAEFLATTASRIANVELRYESFATTYIPIGPHERLENVRIIAIRPDTDQLRLPDGRPFGPASTTQPECGRSLHARLLDKLTMTGVTAVAFDITFTRPSDFDKEFADAIRRAESKGVRVVVGVRQWEVDKSGNPQMSAQLLPHVRWGGTTTQMGTREPWGVDLIVRRGDAEPMPSLALATAASVWEPSGDLKYTLDWYTEVAYARSGPSGPGRRVDLSFSHRRSEPTKEGGIRKGDDVGQFFLHMPSDETLRASTISFADVLTADKPKLDEWFDGKCVVVGDERPKRDAYKQSHDGRWFWGFQIHAVAIDALLSDRTIRRARIVNVAGVLVQSRYLLDLAATLAGVALGLFVRRTMPRLFLLVIACLASIAIALLLYRSQLILANPLAMVLAVLISGETVALVERTRRRRMI